MLGALAVVGLLATPVSAAAPIENEWGTITGTAFDVCTDELFDNNGRVHTVLKENASPELSVHVNLHLEAIGESSGDAYVYNTTINSPVHVAADGSYTADQTVHFILVSKGDSPNMRITVRLHQVFASDGTLISETSDFSLDCRGG
jgi:hypothetical protein